METVWYTATALEHISWADIRENGERVKEKTFHLESTAIF